MALYFFFFFQAEDGIRDTSVTGVQTCALPIFPCQRWQGMSAQFKRQVFLCLAADGLPEAKMRQQNHDPHKEHACDRSAVQKRSEERRVGKECKDRWTGDQ